MNLNLIYGLRDPITDEYRYVGKSTSGIKRPMSHFTHSHNNNVNEWIKTLKNKNLLPIIDILEEIDGENELSIRETYWINLFSESCKLFNDNSIDPLRIRISGLEKALLTKEKVLIAKMTQLDGALATWENLGSLMKQRRKMLNLTQEDISEMLNISTRTIQSMEKNNSKINFDYIKKYLTLLGIELVPKIKSTKWSN